MDRFLSNAALCFRAGKLGLGFDKAKETVLHNQAALLLLTSDLSSKSEKEMIYFAHEADTEVLKIPYTMQQMEELFHKKVGILAVLDENFAKLLQRSL